VVTRKALSLFTPMPAVITTAFRATGDFFTVAASTAERATRATQGQRKGGLKGGHCCEGVVLLLVLSERSGVCRGCSLSVSFSVWLCSGWMWVAGSVVGKEMREVGFWDLTKWVLLLLDSESCSRNLSAAGFPHCSEPLLQRHTTGASLTVREPPSPLLCVLDPSQ